MENLKHNDKSEGLMLKMAKYQLKKEEIQKESENELIQIVQEMMNITLGNQGKIKDMKGDIEGIGNTLKVTSIDRFQLAELDSLMKKRVFSYTGGVGSDKYILYFGKYKSVLLNSIKKEFSPSDVPLLSIKDLKLSDFKEAVEYISDWKPSRIVTRKIQEEWRQRIDKYYEGKDDKITAKQIEAFNNVAEKE